MKIAVTFENDQVFGHFGHTKEFAIFEAEGKAIVSHSLLPVIGSGHGALAGLLKENKVDVLICGGIGQGAKDALAQDGIALVAGASGNVRIAAENYLAGNLKNDPTIHCSHHDHEHGEGHNCGEDPHGCGGH